MLWTGSLSYPLDDPVASLQFTAVARLLFAGWEDTFSQHEQGLLDHDQFFSFRSDIIPTMTLPGYQTLWSQWKARRPGTSEKYKAFIDALLPVNLEVSQAGRSTEDSGH